MENVELEILSRNDGRQKPSSAPAECQKIERRSLFRKSTSNKKKKRKSRTISCASLQSLSTLADNTEMRSDPNFFQRQHEDYHDISINDSKQSIDPSVDQYYLESEGSYQTSTIGFRASFFSVLEKLGVVRSQELHKQPSVRKTERHSVTSLYFRSHYGGNFLPLAIS
jgi:hypothetical protein